MTAPIPGGTARPPGSQPLFERARKRVTQRLSLAGLNSGGVGSAKFKIPAVEAAPAPVAPPTPPVPEQVEAVLGLPASVVIPLLPETVLLSDPASLLNSPQGQMDFRLPLGTVLPMLPSGKIEFSIGDLSQCAPEGIIHPLESLGEWATQSVLLPLPQVVMRIPPEFMTLRRDQKPIDTAVAAMDDPFSPEALRAKAEAAQAEQAAQAVQESPAVGGDVPSYPLPVAEEIPAAAPVEAAMPESAPLPEEVSPVEIPPAEPVVEEEAGEPVPAYRAAADPVPSEDAPPIAEPDFSFTQSAEYQALLSKLQMAEEPAAPALPPEPVMEATSSRADSSPEPLEIPPTPAPEPPAPRPMPSFSFPSPAKPPVPETPAANPPEETLPASPLSAAVGAVPALSGSFHKALQGLTHQEKDEIKPPVRRSDLHDLMRLPAEVPAGFKEFTRQLSLWPGMKSCVICGPDGLPIASAGSEGKSGDSLAALAPRLFKNASALLADLGRSDLAEMNFPGEPDSLTLFRNKHFILIAVHVDEQLPTIYRQNIREALNILAQSGPG